jgi:hypothetical protein
LLADFFAAEMALSTTEYNLLTCWLPMLVMVGCVTLLRRCMAHRLRWKSMVLRLTATKTQLGEKQQEGFEGTPVVSAKVRQTLSSLLQNITLLSALGATLSITLLIAPTEVIVEAGDAQSMHAQYFVCLSFLSTGTYIVVAIEAALSLLYLEQYSDAQLHGVLCQKAAEIFVEPLLAFITATVYMLCAGVLFCGYLYGAEAAIGLSAIVIVPIVRVGRSWLYLERFDLRSFALARRLEAGSDVSEVIGSSDGRSGAILSMKREMTVVGQSKLLEAMKELRTAQRLRRSTVTGRDSHRRRTGAFVWSSRRDVIKPSGPSSSTSHQNPDPRGAVGGGGASAPPVGSAGAVQGGGGGDGGSGAGSGDDWDPVGPQVGAVPAQHGRG